MVLLSFPFNATNELSMKRNRHGTPNHKHSTNAKTEETGVMREL